MDMPTEQAENHPSITPRARKRTPLVVLACVALLVFALIVGSVLWLSQPGGTALGPPSKGHILATATTDPTWMPTEVTPPAASTFYDTFVNNSHGWSLSDGEGNYRLLVNNMLILANMRPDTTMVESVPTSTALDDYVVNVDFTLNQGDSLDSTGLYVRGDSHLDHDYRIDINGNATFDVAKESLDANLTPQSTLLVPPQTTSLLNPPGKSNTLTVIMIDQTMTVLINHVALPTITDATYTSGQIALFVRHGTNPKGTIVSFTRVEIDRLASPFATPVPMLKLTPGI